MADGTFVKPGLKESGADSCCRSAPCALSLTSERAALIRQAFHLEWMTVAWMVVEGVVALGATWRERNRHALRAFWARAPADALGVKQELEKALAQGGKPTT